jgi:hypothetical protein
MAVPEAQLSALLDRLRAAGEGAHVVGTASAGAGEILVR